mgnify:CR=1 FL=1
MLIFQLAEIEGEDANLSDLMDRLGITITGLSSNALNVPPRIFIAKLMRNNCLKEKLIKVAKEFLKFKLNS